MTNYSDTDRRDFAKPGPRWPLDLMKVIGSRARYVEKANELSLLLGSEPAESAFGRVLAAEVCARAWALVHALRPADFVQTEVVGAEARDIYHLEPSWSLRLFVAAPGPAGADRWLHRGFRIALMPYQFDDQPRLLFIAISALPPTL